MASIEELDILAGKLKAEGKHMEALEAVEKCLALRQSTYGESSEEVKKSYRQLCDLCNILATYYLQREDSHLALDLLKRAEVLSENDSHAQAITYNNLSCFYRKTNRTKLALKYLKSALNLEQDIPNTHLNLCAVYSQIGKHEQALSHAMQSVIILQDSIMFTLESSDEVNENYPVLTVAYHNMGVELEFLKRNSEALNMYAKAVSFAEEFLPEGHTVMENVKSVYHNALKESQEIKKKKKSKEKNVQKKPNFRESLDKEGEKERLNEKRSERSLKDKKGGEASLKGLKGVKGKAEKKGNYEVIPEENKKEAAGIRKERSEKKEVIKDNEEKKDGGMDSEDKREELKEPVLKKRDEENNEKMMEIENNKLHVIDKENEINKEDVRGVDEMNFKKDDDNKSVENEYEKLM